MSRDLTAWRRWQCRLAQRLFVTAVAIATVVCVTLSISVAEERPDFVILLSDDHGWDEVGYNGHPHLKTPVLDDMASRGLRFDRFYSAHPSCSPTRGSLITGRHPVRYGTFAPNWSLRPEEIGIAQVLADAGYACGLFGKWHLGPVKADSPTNPGALGFHEWLAHDNFFEIDPVLSRNGGPPEKIPGESSAVLVAAAIEFVKKSKEAGKPVFVLVTFGSPHEPYSGLEQDLALYADLPESYQKKTFQLTSNETGLSVTRPLRDVLQERYAEITAMDRAIGQFRDWLGEQKLRDNTLFWYMSDNGASGDGAVTSPFRGQKALMYEGGIRVPGILEWPRKIPEPRVTSVNAVTSDLLPTVCDLLSLPLPERPIDGISLKPLLEGTMTARPQPIGFWAYNINQLMQRKPQPYLPRDLQQGTTPLVKVMDNKFTRSFTNYRVEEILESDYGGPRVMLDQRYKLVVDQSRGAMAKELFDLETDPAEKQNLYTTQPEIAEKLERQLRDWQTSVLKSLTGADYR